MYIGMFYIALRIFGLGGLEFNDATNFMLII